VVLPQPDGPRRAKKVFDGMLSDAFDTAGDVPKRLVTPDNSMALMSVAHLV
jgi:hypothetical protein